jgi:malonate decarboxylase epsilon subunit
VEVPGGGTLARLAQGVFADDAVLDAGSGLDAVRVRIQRQRRINN